MNTTVIGKKTDMTKTTVIIPNYNGKHFLKDCLDALAEQTVRDFITIIVDNGSSDGSLEYLAEEWPDKIGRAHV